jgi:hypothetical protein
MATYNFNITASSVQQPADIGTGVSTVFAITNQFTTDAYFTLETVPNADGAYTPSTIKNTSGSFTLGTGLRELIQSDYITSVIVAPGGGNLTFVPAVSITATNLRLRGIGA